MKYVWIVSSHYQGENAQGNVLGVHGSRVSGEEHYNDVLDDRKGKGRGEILWTTTSPRPDKFYGFQWEAAAFRVGGKWPEIVKLVRWTVTQRRGNEKSTRHRSRK